MPRAMASASRRNAALPQQDKKEQTWEFLRIQAGLRPDARKEFERKFEQKVMNGLYSNSDAGQKSVQEWTDELQAEAQATERLRWSWRTPARNGTDNGRSCGNEESGVPWNMQLKCDVGPDVAASSSVDSCIPVSTAETALQRILHRSFGR